MPSAQHRPGDTFMSSTIDTTGVAVTKASPAVAGTMVSLAEPAQQALSPFLHLPWSTVAAILTCLYTSCLIVDWVWKKYRAWKMYRNEQLKG